MTPLLVRAELAAGVAHHTPWGISLDGLLASVLFTRRRRGEPGTPGAREHSIPPDLPLPLARCRRGPDWHWAATCSYPVGGQPRPEVRQWAAAVDHRHLEHTAGRLPQLLSSRQGRYRNQWMPVLVTVCPAVTWHAVGDRDGVAELLAELTAIGKKRGSGEGQVLAWSVTSVDLDEFTAGHLHPDGTLGRAAPPQCLGGRRVVTGGHGWTGLRPPYMHPARQQQLALPAAVELEMEVVTS